MSCYQGKMVISIFYVDYDGAGTGKLYLFSTIFGLHYNGVFLCFLIGIKEQSLQSYYQTYLTWPYKSNLRG